MQIKMSMPTHTIVVTQSASRRMPKKLLMITIYGKNYDIKETKRAKKLYFLFYTPLK